VKVVQQTLLPSLNPNPAGVEALRIYLLLPELIRGLQGQQRTELTGALAYKILDLNPAALKMLGKAGGHLHPLCCCPCSICNFMFHACCILRDVLVQTP